MGTDKIWIVDDEADLAGIFYDYLKSDFTVEVFHSAERALEAYSSQNTSPPNVVVTDLQMPGIEGIEFIERLRKAKYEQSIIVVSGYAEKTHAIKAIDNQVFGFIEKPFELLQLRKLIDAASLENSMTALIKKCFETYAHQVDNLKTVRNLYIERYTAAENLLYQLDVEIFPSRPEIKKFLSKVKKENTVEKAIEETEAQLLQLRGMMDILNNLRARSREQLTSPSTEVP